MDHETCRSLPEVVHSFGMQTVAWSLQCMEIVSPMAGFFFTVGSLTVGAVRTELWYMQQTEAI